MARCGCSGADCSMFRGCISAGTGIDYDSSTGVISAEALECSAVRGCLSEGPGINYDSATGQISAEIATCANVRTCITGTNGIVFNQGTGVATLNASNGCGILGNGTPADPLRANVSTWPFACAPSNGGGIYCDGDVLRGEPMPKMQFFGQTFSQQEPDPGTLIPGPVTQIATYSMDITNPDPCRPAMVIGVRLLDLDFTLPSGGEASAGMEGDVLWHVENTGATQQNLVHWQTEKAYSLTIAPGATVSESTEIFVSQGLGGARWNRIQSSISAWVISLPA